VKKTSLSLNIGRNQFAFIAFLLLNTLTWSRTINELIAGALQNMAATDVQTLTVHGIYLAGIIFSGIIGAFLLTKMKRSTVILVWIALGVLVTFFSAFFLSETKSIERLEAIVFTYGVASGLGLPIFFASFADATTFENRGHVGGIALFITFLSFPVLALASSSDITINAIVSGSWRAIGLVALIFKPKETLAVKKDESSPSRLLRKDRSFFLYLIPWFMFCLIDRFAFFSVPEAIGQELFDFSRVVEPIGATLFVLVGGFLCDRIGRKKIVVAGFIALGLAYAAMGLAPSSLYSAAFYIMVDSVAWGIFTLMFVLVVWGDLASVSGGITERYYAFGIIPFFVADLMSYVAKVYIGAIPKEALYPLASLLLFIAVLPLMYAPETLPEKEIQKREIEDYLGKAKKVREKYR
jgi:hypothetical protein